MNGWRGMPLRSKQWKKGFWNIIASVTKEQIMNTLMVPESDSVINFQLQNSEPSKAQNLPEKMV